jgi:methyl-accepting chemotaxis protein
MERELQEIKRLLERVVASSERLTPYVDELEKELKEIRQTLAVMNERSEQQARKAEEPEKKW